MPGRCSISNWKTERTSKPESLPDVMVTTTWGPFNKQYLQRKATHPPTWLLCDAVSRNTGVNPATESMLSSSRSRVQCSILVPGAETLAGKRRFLGGLATVTAGGGKDT